MGLRGTGRQARCLLVFAIIQYILCQAIFDPGPRPAVPEAPRLLNPTLPQAPTVLILAFPKTPTSAPWRWEWSPQSSRSPLRTHFSDSPDFSSCPRCFLQLPRPTPASGLCHTTCPLACSYPFIALFTSPNSGPLFANLSFLSPLRGGALDVFLKLYGLASRSPPRKGLLSEWMHGGRKEPRRALHQRKDSQRTLGKLCSSVIYTCWAREDGHLAAARHVGYLQPASVSPSVIGPLGGGGRARAARPTSPTSPSTARACPTPPTPRPSRLSGRAGRGAAGSEAAPWAAGVCWARADAAGSEGFRPRVVGRPGREPGLERQSAQNPCPTFSARVRQDRCGPLALPPCPEEGMGHLFLKNSDAPPWFIQLFILRSLGFCVTNLSARRVAPCPHVSPPSPNTYLLIC